MSGAVSIGVSTAVGTGPSPRWASAGGLSSLIREIRPFSIVRGVGDVSKRRRRRELGSRSVRADTDQRNGLSRGSVDSGHALRGNAVPVRRRSLQDVGRRPELVLAAIRLCGRVDRSGSWRSLECVSRYLPFWSLQECQRRSELVQRGFAQRRRSGHRDRSFRPDDALCNWSDGCVQVHRRSGQLDGGQSGPGSERFPACDRSGIVFLRVRRRQRSRVSHDGRCAELVVALPRPLGKSGDRYRDRCDRSQPSLRRRGGARHLPVCDLRQSFTVRVESHESLPPRRRFQVRVAFRPPGLGEQRRAGCPDRVRHRAFWFFSGEQPRADRQGRGRARRQWPVLGLLRSAVDVAYTVTVRDTQTGATKVYESPQGTLSSVADTAAFEDVDDGTPPPDPPPGFAPAADGPGLCGGGAGALCLNAGRFRAEVSWRLSSGSARHSYFGPSHGRRRLLSGSSARTTSRLLIKVVDGRAANGKFWVFAGGLSDVEYTITVTDAQTGAVRTYTNAEGPVGEVRGNPRVLIRL